MKTIKQKLCTGEFGIISHQRNPSNVRAGYLKYPELKTMYDMGFRNFKICGRRKTMYGLAWNVVHFMFNPKIAAPFASAFAHKIDEHFRGEFKKLGMQQQDDVDTKKDII